MVSDKENKVLYHLPPEEIGEPGKFGLLMGKNMSLGPWQTVNTGASNQELISQTLAYNGKTQYKVKPMEPIDIYRK